MKNCTILAAFIAICACISCRKSSELPTYFGRDTTINYLTWTHLDSVYVNDDINILASCALTDKTLMLATKSGISYFNTITNRVDSFVAFKRQFNGYPVAHMNKYFTAYQDMNGFHVYDNNNLTADPIDLSVDKSVFWPDFVIFNNKLFYQYNISRGAGTTGVMTLKAILLDMDTTVNSSKYINGYTEKEINLPLDSFVSAAGLLNVMKSFDSEIYFSFFNHFYRIDADGNYERIKVNGRDIYPNCFFKTKEAMVALSNNSRDYSANPLFYSADGTTWKQSFASGVNYDEIKSGIQFSFENQPYVCAGWGNIYLIGFSGESYIMNYINSGNRHVLDIKALYPVAGKYVYSISHGGIYMINRSCFPKG